MKKLLSIAMASLAVAAFADPPANTASPTIGVTAITTSLQSTIVSVPFTSLNGGGAIDITQLVSSDGFVDGDALYVFKDNSYSAWVFGNGVWTATSIASTSGGFVDASGVDGNKNVASPGAIWVVFKTKPNEPKTFYIYGQFVAASAQQLVFGSNLVANQLQGTAVPTITNPAKKDAVILINDAGGIRYSYTQLRGKPETLGWYQNGSSTKLDALPAIAQGQGFWYIRNTDNSEASVSWNLQ